MLDDAIAECQTAIDKNRQNAYLRTQLLTMYSEKQRTLQDVLREGTTMLRINKTLIAALLLLAAPALYARPLRAHVQQDADVPGRPHLHRPLHGPVTVHAGSGNDVQRSRADPRLGFRNRQGHQRHRVLIRERNRDPDRVSRNAFPRSRIAVLLRRHRRDDARQRAADGPRQFGNVDVTGIHAASEIVNAQGTSRCATAAARSAWRTRSARSRSRTAPAIRPCRTRTDRPRRQRRRNARHHQPLRLRDRDRHAQRHHPQRQRIGRSARRHRQRLDRQFVRERDGVERRRRSGSEQSERTRRRARHQRPRGDQEFVRRPRSSRTSAAV